MPNDLFRAQFEFVPDAWQLVPLRVLMNVESGREVPVEVQKDDKAVPVYGSGLLPFKYTDRSISSQETIVFGRKGTIGQPYLVRPPYWLVDTAYSATPKNGTVLRYLYFLLSVFDWQPFVTNTAKPSLVANDILAEKVPFPSPIEQKDIATHLDSKTADIDGLVAKLERERELLERYRRELIAHTVTRGLNPDVPRRDSGTEWIGEIPSTWCERPLKSMLRRVSVKNHPESRVLSVERAKGVVDRELEGSPDNHNRLPDDLSSYLVVEAGQFVMNKMKAWRGSYGVSKLDGIVSPAYFTFELDCPNPDFFNWAIRSDAYVPFFGRDSYGIRVDQWDFKSPALRTIPFILPPVGEQEAIVSYLEEKTEEIGSTVAGIDQQIELLKKYRKQVINDAVTGKVRVGEVA